MELRDGSDINTVIGRRAGFLRRDGQVVGLNGGFGIAFDDVLPGTFYIAVYHRSHIAVFDGLRLADGPVARAWFDHHIPITFHGNWLAG